MEFLFRSITMKICSTCNQSKPDDDFYSRASKCDIEHVADCITDGRWTP